MDSINWESLNWLDILLGGTVIISAIVGLMRGFLKEALSIVAWIVALYCAYTFSDMVAKEYISKFIGDANISYLAALGGIFLTTLFVFGLLNLLISLLLKATGLGFTDRFLGLAVGIARGAVIGALIIFMISFVGNPNKFEAWRDSQLKGYFIPLANWGLKHLPKQIQDNINGRNDSDAGILHSSSDGTPTITLESLPQQEVDPNVEVEVRETPEEPINEQNTDDQPPLTLESTQ